MLGMLSSVLEEVEAAFDGYQFYRASQVGDCGSIAVTRDASHTRAGLYRTASGGGGRRITDVGVVNGIFALALALVLALFLALVLTRHTHPGNGRTRAPHVRRGCELLLKTFPRDFLGYDNFCWWIQRVKSCLSCLTI